MVAELASVAPDGSGQQVGYIPIEQIRNDVPQVRRDWRHDEGNERLEELTQSIRNYGVLQPIEVEALGDGTYQLLVGARRFVASRRAGLPFLPAVVRNATPQERILLQLTENVQRHNLSALDEGSAYADLIQMYGYSIRQVAELLGISRPTVANKVRVFHDDVLSNALRSGLITPAEAQAITTLAEPYADELRKRLRDGCRVTRADVQAMRRRQGDEGVINPRYCQRVPPGDSSGVRSVPPLTERQQRALEMRDAGRTFEAVGAALGVGESRARRFHRAAARLRDRLAQRAVDDAALPALPAPPKPNVTFNGVNLDPIIAKAQERAEAERAAPPQATDVPAPHPRPLRSPLPWENHDDSPVRYGVDPAGLVHPEPQPQQEAPPQSAAPAAVAAQPPAPLQCVPAPPLVVDDPDVTRLRFMLHGAQQPCRDLLGAMLTLGREKGWSCHELWRKRDQASRAR